jgi:hypothetical protein
MPSPAASHCGKRGRFAHARAHFRGGRLSVRIASCRRLTFRAGPTDGSSPKGDPSLGAISFPRHADHHAISERFWHTRMEGSARPSAELQSTSQSVYRTKRALLPRRSPHSSPRGLCVHEPASQDRNSVAAQSISADSGLAPPCSDHPLTCAPCLSTP